MDFIPIWGYLKSELRFSVGTRPLQVPKVTFFFFLPLTTRQEALAVPEISYLTIRHRRHLINPLPPIVYRYGGLSKVPFVRSYL